MYTFNLARLNIKLIYYFSKYFPWPFNLNKWSGISNLDLMEWYISNYAVGLVAQSCVWPFATPWTIAHQAPLSMEILQATKLEWVAMPSSRGSSQPRDQTQVPCIAGGFFTIWVTRDAHIWLSFQSKMQVYKLHNVHRMTAIEEHSMKEGLDEV